MTAPDRRWTDADRELVAKAVHGHACMGDDCSWSEEPRACDLTEFAGFGEAVLDALTAAGWRPVPEGWRVQADRDGDMTLQCLTCFHDYDLDVSTEDLTLPRLVELTQKHEHQGGSDGA